MIRAPITWEIMFHVRNLTYGKLEIVVCSDGVAFSLRDAEERKRKRGCSGSQSETDSRRS